MSEINKGLIKIYGSLSTPYSFYEPWFKISCFIRRTSGSSGKSDNNCLITSCSSRCRSRTPLPNWTQVASDYPKSKKRNVPIHSGRSSYAIRACLIVYPLGIISQPYKHVSYSSCHKQARQQEPDLKKEYYPLTVPGIEEHTCDP